MNDSSMLDTTFKSSIGDTYCLRVKIRLVCKLISACYAYKIHGKKKGSLMM